VAKKTQDSDSVDQDGTGKPGHLLPGLQAMKNQGVSAIEVHFQGSGDDGWYDYRVISELKEIELSKDAIKEIEGFLQEAVQHYGEGPGSVLLARFDLLKSVCHVYEGEGDPGTRLGELLAVLNTHGVTKVNGELRSQKLSECKVEPEQAMACTTVSEYVDHFLDLVDTFVVEYGDFDEETMEVIPYEGELCALLDEAGGSLSIDVSNRRAVLTRATDSETIEIAVDELAEASFPLSLS
jgi:hypothetical protein